MNTAARSKRFAGLSQSPVRDRLIFKGGTALKKCYFPDYRFSEDNRKSYGFSATTLPFFQM
ncbi:MAG TPA: nucleotidyl transferase AbiEii/AbiGii toxin family protein [Verrucomicrobiae bacterium]|nr:nucleotidyl transferase AbiEii/AbiGii toxin family protein [Verrucomicrobiae bacterium]